MPTCMSWGGPDERKAAMKGIQMEAFGNPAEVAEAITSGKELQA